MTNGVGKTAFNARSRSPVWAGYAACAWGFAFAAVSFYWAAGGTAGADMIGPGITEPVLAREPVWVAILWATGILKILAGLLALALVRPWGNLVPRWLPLTATWGVGALLILYGGAGLVEAGLMETGVIRIPESMDLAAIRWKLVLWQPFWLLGGALFLAAAWSYGRRS